MGMRWWEQAVINLEGEKEVTVAAASAALVKVGVE